MARQRNNLNLAVSVEARWGNTEGSPSDPVETTRRRSSALKHNEKLHDIVRPTAIHETVELSRNDLALAFGKSNKRVI